MSIRPRIQDDDPAPELSELVLTIEAGERITIGAVTVLGTPLEPQSDVIRSLGLARRPAI